MACNGAALCRAAWCVAWVAVPNWDWGRAWVAPVTKEQGGELCSNVRADGQVTAAGFASRPAATENRAGQSRFRVTCPLGYLGQARRGRRYLRAGGSSAGLARAPNDHMAIGGVHKSKETSSRSGLFVGM